MASESQHRHLKDLLKEEQEPYLIPTTTINQNASFPSHFCKNPCFFPSSNAHSPLFSPAAAKTPSRALSLHVPAKTAALLLEAAVRIHKPKTRIKNPGFALLGSVISRLTHRSHTRKIQRPETREGDVIKTSAIRVGLETSLVERPDPEEDSIGVWNARLSSVWSEENKSSPPSSSSSSSPCRCRSRSRSLSEVGFVNGGNGDTVFTFILSPFLFALHRSPSPDLLSPVFSSPARSPTRHNFQDYVNYEQDPSVKSHLKDEEEEKDQSSPVSILDSPFGDDDCEAEEGECREDEHGFDTECSYAFMQRSKQHLLQKLLKFEALDPIELEKRMEEDEGEDDYEELEHYEYGNDNDDHSAIPDIRRHIEGYVVDISRDSGVGQELMKPGMKRLLSDLICKEERSAKDYELVVKRVCKRLECWKEVEANTIDMIIGMDLREEHDDWKKVGEDISWTAKMLEASLFSVLVDELLDDLVF